MTTYESPAYAPVEVEEVTAAKRSTIADLRPLFPAVEEMAQAAISATIAHVESGSCVAGGTDFLRSLGIDVPTEDREVTVVVACTALVNVPQTVEVNVLEAASGEYGDSIDTPTRGEVLDVLRAGGYDVDLSYYGDFSIEEVR